MIDLHIHTQNSNDCRLSVEDILNFYGERGFETLAITDHDSVDGLSHSALVRRSADKPVVVPGVELTLEEGSYEFHMLAYGFRVDAQTTGFLHRIEEAKRQGTISYIDPINKRLRTHGLSPVDREKLLARHERLHSFHIAREIMASSRITFDDVYRRFINPIRRSQSRGLPTVSQAIQSSFSRLILAHPYKQSHSLSDFARGDGAVFRRMLRSLVDGGVAGVEVFSRHHTIEQMADMLTFADELGIVVTGGSDLHSWSDFEVFARIVATAGNVGLSFSRVAESLSDLLKT